MYQRAYDMVLEAEAAKDSVTRQALLDAAVEMLPPTFVSSTALAPALLDGQIDYANEMLGLLTSFWG